MIKNIVIRNVKCFPSVSFDMAPLTIFCGANSAGKSTAIQCLLMAKQSYDAHKFLEKKINLTGPFFSVGHVKDLVSQNINGEDLSILIDDCKLESVPLISVDPTSYSLPLKDNEIRHKFFDSPFHYLNAYRLAPQNSYDVNFDSDKIDFGIYGQYVIAELHKLRHKPAINQELARISVELTRKKERKNNFVDYSEPTSVGNVTEDSPEFYNLSKDNEEVNFQSVENYLEKSKVNTAAALGENKKNKLAVNNEEYSLEVALKETMKRICKGFDIETIGYEELDKVSNSFGSNETSYAVRPINTGFGISNVLPIIVAGLCTPPGGILIVENPEVHLHPAAQSEIANFLGHVSKCGVQVIIETHSDHIINGVRIFGKNNTLDSDHIIINNIRIEKGNRVVTPIRICEDGGLSDIDDGFFDQAEKDLMRLFE
ncbi:MULTISPECIES: AAA family ATPase [Serratia]|uniref:AAA family ATPase n=2 Tax=Serratia TaxID=613 RepID=UPI00313DCCBF|nr:hypothetical protein SMKC032_09890 [Serratia marcescens]